MNHALDYVKVEDQFKLQELEKFTLEENMEYIRLTDPKICSYAYFEALNKEYKIKVLKTNDFERTYKTTTDGENSDNSKNSKEPNKYSKSMNCLNEKKKNELKLLLINISDHRLYESNSISVKTVNSIFNNFNIQVNHATKPLEDLLIDLIIRLGKIKLVKIPNNQFIMKLCFDTSKKNRNKMGFDFRTDMLNNVSRNTTVTTDESYKMNFLEFNFRENKKLYNLYEKNKILEVIDDYMKVFKYKNMLNNFDVLQNKTKNRPSHNNFEIEKFENNYEPKIDLNIKNPEINTYEKRENKQIRRNIQ